MLFELDTRKAKSLFNAISASRDNFDALLPAFRQKYPGVDDYRILVSAIAACRSVWMLPDAEQAGRIHKVDAELSIFRFHVQLVDQNVTLYLRLGKNDVVEDVRRLVAPTKEETLLEEIPKAAKNSAGKKKGTDGSQVLTLALDKAQRLFEIPTRQGEFETLLATWQQQN